MQLEKILINFIRTVARVKNFFKIVKPKAITGADKFSKSKTMIQDFELQILSIMSNTMTIPFSAISLDGIFTPLMSKNRKNTSRFPSLVTLGTGVNNLEYMKNKFNYSSIATQQ